MDDLAAMTTKYDKLSKAFDKLATECHTATDDLATALITIVSMTTERPSTAEALEDCLQEFIDAKPEEHQDPTSGDSFVTFELETWEALVDDAKALITPAIATPEESGGD